MARGKLKRERASRTLKRKRRPVAVDFFCGAGGMSLGFEQASFDIVYATDIDGHHVAVHSRNFPNCRTVCQPIEDFHLGELTDIIEDVGEIDLVFGGPPCQGFSNMGLRDSKDPRNTLVDRFAKVIQMILPKAFVMENVPGMLAGETRRVLDRFIKRLESCHYTIAKPVQVLDASDFGVPQKRTRLFVIGIRNDLDATPRYPSRACAGQPPRPTVAQAISDLPRVSKHLELFKRNWVDYDKEPRTAYSRVARGKARDPSDYSYPRIWNDGICSGVLRVRHSEKTKYMYSVTPPGQTVPGHKLPRLDPKGVAPTLRAGSDSSHGSYTAPRPVHPFEPRCITVKEAARLHGYPDWFELYPIKWHAYRQIGNSVCPPVSRAIGQQILRAMGIRASKPRKTLVLGANFDLPKNRKMGKRRIPHMEHYPPVIRHLFRSGFNEKNSRLWRSKFTFDDVREAIKSTGVKLPWVRKDIFLQDIARSRNVIAILKDCLSAGYSIRPITDRSKFIGEFVPISEIGTIEKREAIIVRTKDISEAVDIGSSTLIKTSNPMSCLAILKATKLPEILWGDSEVTVEMEDAPKRNGSGVYCRFRRCKRGRTVRLGLAYFAKFGTPPSYSRLDTIASSSKASEVLVMIPVTKAHIHAVVLRRRDGDLKEYANRVFAIRDQSSKP